MLNALFYPAGTKKNPIKFDSLFIPWIYKEIYMDGVYADILNQKKDMVILDVGANIGVFTSYMRDFAKKIYAIEPSPEHFEALEKNKEFNKWDNVEVFNVAMADKDGEMTLTMNDYNRTMNTLIIGKPAKDGRYELETGVEGLKGTIGAKGYDSNVKVKTVAFDSFLEQNNIDEVDFVKFDVEGSEDMILRSEGFRKVAPKIKAIEIEFHYPSWKDLAKYMIELGYEARQYECSAIVVLFTRK